MGEWDVSENEYSNGPLGEAPSTQFTFGPNLTRLLFNGLDEQSVEGSGGRQFFLLVPGKNCLI